MKLFEARALSLRLLTAADYISHSFQRWWKPIVNEESYFLLLIGDSRGLNSKIEFNLELSRGKRGIHIILENGW